MHELAAAPGAAGMPHAGQPGAGRGQPQADRVVRRHRQRHQLEAEALLALDRRGDEVGDGGHAAPAFQQRHHQGNAGTLRDAHLLSKSARFRKPPPCNTNMISQPKNIT